MVKKVYAAVLLCLLMVSLFALPAVAQAQEGKTVRVGWYESSGKPGKGTVIVIDGHNGGPHIHGVFKDLPNLTAKRGVSANTPCSIGLHSTEYLPLLHALFGDFSAENVPKNAKNRPFL